MKPVALHIRRFGSVIDEVFTFPDQAGLFFLSGKNGFGKSTVWKALTWCLFGKDAKGLKAGDVVNWEYTGDTAVDFTFTRDDQYEYGIRRTQSPNSWNLAYGSEDDPGVFVDLVKDETNELYSLLRLDFETWLHTVLLAQDAPMFLDLKPTDKAALFAEVMQLDKWQGYAEVASGKADVEALAIRGLEKDEARLAGELSSIRDYTAELEGFDKERTVELLEIVARYDNKLSDSKKAKRYLESVVQAAEDARAALRVDDLHCRAIEEAVDASEGILCPTCDQPVVDHVQLEVRDTARKQAEKARKASVMSEDTLRSARIEYEAVERELDRLEETASGLQHKPNPFAGLQDTATANRERIGREHRRVTRELVAATERASLLGFWVRGFKDIRLQLISESLDHLAAEVNGCLSQLGLDGWELIFEVDRETKKGSIARGFNVFVQGPKNTRQVPWESWSGGEAQRLRVATQMGLANLIRHSTGASIALEVWDEPSNGLEAEGIVDLLAALSQRAQDEKRQIWVTDHHALGSSAFDGTVIVTKDELGSHYAASTA